MEIHTLGIDLGKTAFHLVGLNPRGEVGGTQEVLAQPDSAFHGQPARVLDRDGSLRRGPLSRPCSARAGS